MFFTFLSKRSAFTIKVSWISVSYTNLPQNIRVWYLFFDLRGIYSASTLFWTFEAIDFRLNSELGWQARCNIASRCLSHWSEQNILILTKPFTSERRTDLVLSSPRWINSLLSMTIKTRTMTKNLYLVTYYSDLLLFLTLNKGWKVCFLFSVLGWSFLSLLIKLVLFSL